MGFTLLRAIKIKEALFYSYLILLIGLILVALRQEELLRYILWGDEAETIVTAKMIAADLSLYSEIFNHHGPLTFLPGHLLELFGSFGISAHRLVIVVLQWVVLYSIFSSSLIKSQFLKNLLVLFTAYYMVVILPFYYGHMYQYQTLAGLLAVIVVIRYILPMIYMPELTSKAQSFIANMLVASLPFLAIPFISASILFFLAMTNRSNYKIHVLFFGAGVLLNVIYLLMIGSLTGYFVDHLFINSTILSEYSGGGLSLAHIAMRIFNFFTIDILGFVLLCTFMAVAIKVCLSENKSVVLKLSLLLFGIASFLYRANTGFQALPFYYGLIIIPFILLISRSEWNVKVKFMVLVVPIILLIKLGLILGPDRTQLQSMAIPTSTPFSSLVKALTNKNDKIISYSFSNHEYIYSNRLPASGNFFYLPWQEKYNKNSILGIKIDSCQDIKNNKPKLMKIDKWIVWQKYTWDSYAGCIQDVIDVNYSQIDGTPIYVRKDDVSGNLKSIIGLDKTDSYWDHGMFRTEAIVLLKVSLENLSSIVKGSTLDFSGSGKRTVTKIALAGEYIYVHVDGAILDPKRDGYPNKIKVLEAL